MWGKKITRFLKPRYYIQTIEYGRCSVGGGIAAHSYRDKHCISLPKRLKQTGAHSKPLANHLFVHLHLHVHSMDVHKFLLTALLLSLLNYASYATKSWEEEYFLKTCSSHRCNKHHGPEIRFPFRLSTHPPSCGVSGMQLSCSGHDTILDHQVLGPCKVTAIYYRHLIMNVIPLVGSSSQCPLQNIISTNKLTELYKPVQLGSHDSVLVGCSVDSVATNQGDVVGPRSCLSLSKNASQFWYLVRPQTDMSTLPLGCEVVAKSIPIPYTYDKNGPKFKKFFSKALFKDRANEAINFGETPFNWSLNSITSICQRCEQEGRHCGFNPNRRQAFCQQRGTVSGPRSHTVVLSPFKL